MDKEIKDELHRRVAADQRYTELTAAAEKVRTKIREVAQLPPGEILKHMPELLELLARVECGRQGIVDEITIQIQREEKEKQERKGNAAGSRGKDKNPDNKGI